MKTSEIRESFLSFFERKQHIRFKSSSLIPENDPTLLFNSAGMNQFKDYFTGKKKPKYPRVTSSQKCLRAGGKNSDLENVGYSGRHHTFFEMLGSFSFGDYFKDRAIELAWEFLTQVLRIPKENLWVTVYESDSESYDIWRYSIELSPDRIIRIGENKSSPSSSVSDNFWTMGDTGPCGPCTEIFYDHGPGILGDIPGSKNENGDRYTEIWNIVFIQFIRNLDGSLEPIPTPSVDTGMGLERISAVMQGVHTNYNIDLFRNLISSASSITGCKNTEDSSLKVIVDHIRASGFLIADGVLPSNEGRGYVLRRIIRRASRHGSKLGAPEIFLHRLVTSLVNEMKSDFPELAEEYTKIKSVIKKEEERFCLTLKIGLKVLKRDLMSIKQRIVPGHILFKLYDTYGFPLELTKDILREHNLTADELGFNKEMENQRLRARQKNNFKYNDKFNYELSELSKVAGPTHFVGYAKYQEYSRIVALYKEERSVSELLTGEYGIVILDKTPFYAESGGQIGDKGVLQASSMSFHVSSTSKKDGKILHHGFLSNGSLTIGQNIDSKIDIIHRKAISINHSATHLLHAALRKNLGEHVEQRGSLVTSKKIRFDFCHPMPLSVGEIKMIENIINLEIGNNSKVIIKNMSLEDIRKKGIMALFSEKYGENKVRVLSLGGSFSVEACGGTHVQYSGEIGMVKITSETGIASGIRRIEMVAGNGILDYISFLEQEETKISQLIGGSRKKLYEKISSLLDYNSKQKNRLEYIQPRYLSLTMNALLENIVEFNGVKILSGRVDGENTESLSLLVNKLMERLKTAVILLGGVNENRSLLVAGVTKNLNHHLEASALIKESISIVSGKGGGRAHLARGSGPDTSSIESALKTVIKFTKNNL